MELADKENVSVFRGEKMAADGAKTVGKEPILVLRSGGTPHLVGFGCTTQCGMVQKQIKLFNPSTDREASVRVNEVWRCNSLDLAFQDGGGLTATIAPRGSAVLKISWTPDISQPLNENIQITTEDGIKAALLISGVALPAAGEVPILSCRKSITSFSRFNYS